MTTSTPIPATEVASPMVNPSDTAPEASTEQAQARAGAATVVRPSLRAQVAENPLLSFFGLLIVALLAAAIASPHIRIDDINLRIGRLEAKVDRLEVRVDRLEARFIEFERRVDARFDMVDARFDKLEAAVAEIDRKLTALIAHLNATTAVDDALAGRLTGPSGPDASGTGDDEPG
ncbi:MAG: hypothetical protein F4118_08045 [Acidimicrobiaceae bacterium]|nr:hypothetical protein [Acidimicrobiaceae bacterium]MYI36369.1 hypothetical protein [Acidimicrobiaceae bacterium]